MVFSTSIFFFFATFDNVLLLLLWLHNSRYKWVLVSLALRLSLWYTTNSRYNLHRTSSSITNKKDEYKKGVKWVGSALLIHSNWWVAKERMSKCSTLNKISYLEKWVWKMYWSPPFTSLSVLTWKYKPFCFSSIGFIDSIAKYLYFIFYYSGGIVGFSQLFSHNLLKRRTTI